MSIVWVDFFICFFGGSLGIHKFREHKPGMGTLYLFTAGLFMFGWFYDSIQYFIAALRKERVKALPKHLGNNEPLPVVSNSNIMLHNSELCHYCEAAVLSKTENQVVGYSSRAHGISVPIIAGISYGTGGLKTTAIRADIQEKAPGVLSITSQRIIFSSSKISFEQRISYLTALTPVKGGLLFQFGTQSYLILTKDSRYIGQIFNRISKITL